MTLSFNKGRINRSSMTEKDDQKITISTDVLCLTNSNKLVHESVEWIKTYGIEVQD